MENTKNIDATNLSTFIQSMERIERSMEYEDGIETAEVIVTYTDEYQPIRLIGFSTDGEKTDFEIYEEAYAYYKELVGLIDLLKTKGL